MTTQSLPHPRSSVLRVAIAYGLMIVATLLIFLLIRSLGGALHAPATTGAARFGSAAGQQQVDTLQHVLVALAVVIITARLLGGVFKHLGQPPVIGEVVAGTPPRPLVSRPRRTRGLRVSLAASGRSVLQRPRPGRRDPLHVPRRPPARHGNPTPGHPRHDRYLACQHHCAVPARRGPRAVDLPAAVEQRRALHGVRAVHGRLDVRHRLPGARADPDRPGYAQEPDRRHRAHVCGGGRRHRVVPAGLRGRASCTHR